MSPYMSSFGIPFPSPVMYSDYTMITPKRELGNLGEKIALGYLKKNDYQILERNYQKKWGEIDIIAQLKENIVFIEVKSKSKGPRPVRDGLKGMAIRPEQNVNFLKQKRLIRAAQTYLLERKISPEKPWQIDVIAIELDLRNRRASLRHLKNVVWA